MLYKIVISDYRFFIFTRKLKFSIFLKYMSMKSKILDVSKKRNIYYKPTYKRQTYQISKQCLYFGLCNAKKQIEVMRSLFEMQPSALLNIVRQNK